MLSFQSGSITKREIAQITCRSAADHLIRSSYHSDSIRSPNLKKKQFFSHRRFFFFCIALELALHFYQFYQYKKNKKFAHSLKYFMHRTIFLKFEKMSSLFLFLNSDRRYIRSPAITQITACGCVSLTQLTDHFAFSAQITDL